MATIAIGKTIATQAVVETLSDLYAGYGREAQVKPAEGRAAQAAISQAMLRLGLIEACRDWMGRPR